MSYSKVEKLTVCEVCRKRVPISKVTNVKDKYSRLHGLVVCTSHLDKTRNQYHLLADAVKEKVHVDYDLAREHPEARFTYISNADDIYTGNRDDTLTGDAPGAPFDLRETQRNASAGTITLKWTPNRYGGSSTITGYKIERNDSGIGWTTLVANTGKVATSYQDTTITVDSFYDYRVSAINYYGTSAVSNTYTVNTLISDADILIDNSGNILTDSSGNILITN